MSDPVQDALHDMRQSTQRVGVPVWNVLIPETKRPCRYCKQIPKFDRSETQYGRTYKYYRCGCKSPLIEGVQ